MKYFSETCNLLLELCILLLGYIIIKLGITKNLNVYGIVFALAFGLGAISLAVISFTTVRRLDKKYKQKLYEHPKGKSLILTIVPLPGSFLIRIRLFRHIAYMLLLGAERGKKGMFYEIQQEILPECSYKNDVKIYDKIIFLSFAIFGFFFLVFGIIWIYTIYF